MIGVLIANVLKKIVELIKFNDTILELGSGKSSELLNKFYNVISVEDNKEWMNKYNTQYIHVNTVGKGEYDFKELSKKIKIGNLAELSEQIRSI